MLRQRDDAGMGSAKSVLWMKMAVGFGRLFDVHNGDLCNWVSPWRAVDIQFLCQNARFWGYIAIKLA